MQLDITGHDRSHVLHSPNSWERIVTGQEYMRELCTDFKKFYDAVRSFVLLRTSAMVRKKSTMFLISVCMSFRMKELDCDWTDVHRIDI